MLNRRIPVLRVLLEPGIIQVPAYCMSDPEAFERPVSLAIREK
jgi:hypothetical protein